MGYFSWMFADKANRSRLKIGQPAYVPCPDGTVIFEPAYDGYGHFGGKDIYELVAEWNRDSMQISDLVLPKRESYGEDEQGGRWYEIAMSAYTRQCSFMTDFKSGKSEEYMLSTYGEDWKRFLGIDIACYDWKNASLKYPIKICSREVAYDAVGASKMDPRQGWF